VPEDLNSTLQEYTEQGYRVIALGRRTLADISYSKIQRMRREDMEQDLEFLGMIVLENRLKPETEPVIGVLKGAHLKIVMITGAKRKLRIIPRPFSRYLSLCSKQNVQTINTSLLPA
jgi:cation-transporting ATPase 13A3/4/5